MKKRNIGTFVALLGFLACGEVTKSPGLKDGQIGYPEGYRSWTHVKSMLIQPGHALYNPFGGMHHIYANQKAAEALGKGKAFPDGSYFVFDLLDVETKDSAIVEKERKILGVMYKDAKHFSKTGGWGFEGFQGNTKKRLVTDGGQSCFACHASQKDKDYVFSGLRP